MKLTTLTKSDLGKPLLWSIDEDSRRLIPESWSGTALNLMDAFQDVPFWALWAMVCEKLPPVVGKDFSIFLRSHWRSKFGRDYEESSWSDRERYFVASESGRYPEQRVAFVECLKLLES